MSSKWHEIWADCALALRLLGLITPRELANVLTIDKTSRCCIQRVLRRFRRSSARLGLALWVQRHVTLEFQSHFQELETHQIARSALRDPRVPPRVVSFWAERGEVPNGAVALRPEVLPKRNEHGFVLRFVASQDPKPMLTSVVQHNRRIYTVITLKVTVADTRAIVLRRVGYLKEFGEWRATVAGVDKRRLDEYGALCRYDLVSLDGGIALELDVPRGADSMMDYFLVKRATVTLPMGELLHPFVNKFRPTRPLQSLSAKTPCILVLSFGRLDGSITETYRIAAELVVEPQSSSPSASASTALNPGTSETENPSVSEAAPPHTGIESFDIVTIQATQESLRIPVPLTPGFLWITLLDSTTSSGFYYTTAMLHSGAVRTRASLTLDAQWVPGTLEFYPTPTSRHRRPLKGYFHLSVNMDTHDVEKLSLVAQHLPPARLEPYAAAMESYTRP